MIDRTLTPRVPISAWAALVLAAVLALSVPARGQQFPVAGDGQDLWIVPTGAPPSQFTLLHRRETDPAGTLRQAIDPHVGWVLERGIAAADGQVWLVYEDRSVQSVRAVPPSHSQPWMYAGPRTEPALPRGVELHAVAADRDGLWAMVRVEDRALLDRIDLQMTPQTQSSFDDLVQPATQSATRPAVAATAPLVEAQPDTQPVTTAPTVVSVDRLLHLEHNRWVHVQLPDDWPQHVRRAWLLMPRPDAPRPWLVALPEEPDADLLVWTWSDPSWSRTAYTIDDKNTEDGATPVPRAAVVIALQGQIIVGRQDRSGQDLVVHVALLRPEGTTNLGTLQLPNNADRPWAFVPVGQSAALIGSDAQNKLHFTSVDLRGHVTPDSLLTVQPRRDLEGIAKITLMTGVLAVATMIMLIFWRRDPTWNRLALPEGLVLADLVRRLAAAAVDMIIPALAVAVAFDFDPVGLLEDWPGHTMDDWGSMLPGAVVIGLFVLTTGVSELFTARTPGKALFGLRVATLEGGSPNLWQVLARNAFKALDLVPPTMMLLMLPVFSPYRQRLGDMVGRTVVVTKAEKPEPPDEDDDEEE